MNTNLAFPEDGIEGSGSTASIVTLSDDECWKRLRSRDLGRVAVVVRGRPEVFPVNYGVVQEVVVFRTAAGVKLDAALHAPVCLEVDDWNGHTGTGWSVMIHGFAREVRNASDPLWTALQGAAVHPVAPGVRPRWVAIRSDKVTGRYFSDGPTPLARTFGRP